MDRYQTHNAPIVHFFSSLQKWSQLTLHGLKSFDDILHLRMSEWANASITSVQLLGIRSIFHSYCTSIFVFVFEFSVIFKFRERPTLREWTMEEKQTSIKIINNENDSKFLYENIFSSYLRCLHGRWEFNYVAPFLQNKTVLFMNRNEKISCLSSC